MTYPTTPTAPKKTPLWQAIAQALTQEIASARYPVGAKLPTEAQFAARFDVNRHTVRRALADLADRGMVHARRGAGCFVAAIPAEYPIGRTVSFKRNLHAAGKMPGRRYLSIETRPAEPDEADALGLGPGSDVHVAEGVSLADGQPISFFQSTFPADPMPDLPELLRVHGSVTLALEHAGIGQFTRASTRLSAQAATALQARHLNLPEGAPVLKSLAINVDQDDRPVEFGRTWFAGDRVVLSFSGSAD
ncbi:MAG: phosphonate metabolism transcriptional regulator PhnF [Pseudomonadota bacterium]